MLKIYAKVADLQNVIGDLKAEGKSVGFVPTMGALHPGHISLIQKAKKENDIVVSSIFVNPTQFNDQKDFTLYPRTLDKDAAMLEEAGCDMLFAPSVDEVYPTEDLKHIDFHPGELGSRMEGASRPGHFEGMLAVVKRLFDIVRPDRAYFGQKDYQQYLIVKEMAEHYVLPLQIVLCPIMREESGLAMSSRNQRLSAEDRIRASLIYKVLRHAAIKIKNGAADANAIREQARAEFGEDRNFTVDYFDICSAKTLRPVISLDNRVEPIIICTAVVLGGIRLIDNLLVE